MGLGADYDSRDAVGLAKLVASGEVYPAELLDEALERARERNPAINALASVREDAARKILRDGPPDGPFRGVPFLLKDLGAAAVDFPGSNGSFLLKDTRYAANSSVVDRLLAAGLVVFGRTTAPEGGVGTGTEAAVYGGPTRNPWNLGRTSGGSSGGASAAVSAGIVPAAHGSDGGGSIRTPASSCGLFGFKATRARAPSGPQSGEGWAGMSTDGFLTRTVRDTAALLDAVSGPDVGAPYHAPPMRGTFSEAMRRPPQPLRIALCAGTFDGGKVHPDCAEATEDAARMLEGLGHKAEEAKPAADHSGMMQAWTRIVACGTASWVRRALQAAGREIRPGDIEGVARGACRLAEGISGADYLDSVNKVHAYGREMERFMHDGGWDILLSPTLAEPPAEVGRFAHDNEDFVDFRTGERGVFPYSPFTACFNASGQPAASLPLGTSADGLPVGVHVAARFGADELLMGLCAQAEAERPWKDKRPPLSAPQS